MNLRIPLLLGAAMAVAAAALVTGCNASRVIPSAPPTGSATAMHLPPPGKLFNWLQPGIDSTHAAYNTKEKTLNAKTIANLKLGWSFSASGSTAPILTDGSLAIANTSNYVYGIAAKTGKQKWSFETYASQNNGFTYAAIGGSLVYVGCNVGGYNTQEGICAVNARSGKLSWSWYINCRCQLQAFNLAAPVVSGSTVVAGYYTGGPYGKNVLIALNATTGALIWEVTAGSGNNSLADAVPAIDGGNVFAGTDYGLCSYQLSSGTLNWCSGPNDAFTAPAISKGVVYISTNSHGFYAFNESTGAQLWQYTPSGYANPFSPPAIAGNTAYFSTSDGGAVYAFNTATGSLLFTAGGGSRGIEIISSPSVANGVVYAACYGGLCAFDASTGNLISTIGPGAESVDSPTISDGRIYVTCGTRSGGFYPCMYDT